MTEAEEIVTEYVTASFDDHWEFARYLHRGRMLFYGALALVGLLLVIFTEPRYKALGGIFIAGWLVDYFYLRWWYWRLATDPKAKLARDLTRARITPEKLIFESKSGAHSEVPWSSLRNVQKHKGNYYLFVARMQSIIMFERAQTPEDWARFSALADEWSEKLKSS